jgi:predicted ATPase
VLVIEDLHWIDKSSEDVLKALLSTIPAIRVLLIFTFRPEYMPPWRIKSYQSQIMLNRLSKREGEQIIEHLDISKDFSSQQKEIILQNAEGVPLFIEEIFKSLNNLTNFDKHNFLLPFINNRQSIAIPPIIQDVIMARVDRLSEIAKEIIQIGSIVGREFSYELIRAVSGSIEDELNSVLSELQESELIFEIGMVPHSVYAFKHSLTREAIYNSILQGKKRELHIRIGRAIEKIYADNLKQHFGILAQHYIIAAENFKAAEYSKLSAKKAIRSGSLDEAIYYNEKLVACLEKLTLTEEGVHSHLVAALELTAVKLV